jgi:LysR family hydrogen peroxide-inducible transcriptional activator
LRDVQDIVDLAHRDRNPLIGRTRLGVLPTLGPYLLPLILPELRRRNPGLKLYIREGLTDDLFGRLGTGDLDLLLTALPLHGDGMESAPLFQEPLHLVVPKGHPLADRRSVRRRDLAGENILTLERGHRLQRDVRELCAQCGAQLLLEYEGTSLDTLRQMVGMGLGLAFLPALYTRLEAPADRQIVVCRLVDKPLARTVSMAWRHAAPRRAQYAQIADLLRRAVHKCVPELAVLRRRAGATTIMADPPSDG